MGQDVLALARWGVLAAAMGPGVGLVGAAFHLAVDWATQMRAARRLYQKLPGKGYLAAVAGDGTDKKDRPGGFAAGPVLWILLGLSFLCSGFYQ